MLYQEGYKNQVYETFSIQTKITPVCPVVTHFISLTLGGKLTISKGYAWDGASGPTLDKEIDLKLFKIKLTDTTVPSCVHDAFAQLMRLELIDRNWLSCVDNLLDQMLKNRGMWWARRRWWMRGLKLTKGSFADPKNRKPVLEAV